jgi:bacteriocin biosynthesis cyclodehydratase domain-containing protein
VKEVSNSAGHRDRRASHRADGSHREGGLSPTEGARLVSSEPGPLGRHRRPRLKSTVEVFPASDGDLYLLAAEERHLCVRSVAPAQLALLRALDGRPVDEVARDLAAGGHRMAREDLEATIDQLMALDLLEDAGEDRSLTPGQVERFERQLRYFGDVADEPRAALQRRLLDSHVVVLGLGGLGSWAAYALACTGIGRMTLVDDDVVELSNLNRQILYTEADLGRAKAEVAAERLRGFHSQLIVNGEARRLTSEAVIEELIAGADLVLELADQPMGLIGSWVNAACFRLGVPHIAAGQFPPHVRIGPLFGPGCSACYECQLTEVRREHPLFDELCGWRREHPSPAATFGPACGLIGSLLANEAVNFLTGLCEPATLGRMLQVDLRTLALSWEPIAPDALCPVCAASSLPAA